jgi:hypothetical protein
MRWTVVDQHWYSIQKKNMKSLTMVNHGQVPLAMVNIMVFDGWPSNTIKYHGVHGHVSSGYSNVLKIAKFLFDISDEFRGDKWMSDAI